MFYSRRLHISNSLSQNEPSYPNDKLIWNNMVKSQNKWNFDTEMALTF
jgi:hypothetical protein